MFIEKEKREAYLKTVCPFVPNPPSTECYTVKMDSQSIISIFEYCIKDYSKCEIYREHLGLGKFKKVRAEKKSQKTL